MDSGDLLVTAAEKVVEILNEHHVDAVVIGAVALAAHQYVRLTDDLDLAVNADLGHMRLLVEALHQAGHQAEFREPGGQDPLGGVIDVIGPFGQLQIISFADRFPAVIDDAVKASTLRVRSGSALRLVPIPHLVALKLYAGGLKSKVDIVELLSRNPQVVLKEIQSLCDHYRLKGFPEILRELGHL